MKPRRNQERAAAVPAASPRSLREAWVALTGLSAVFLFEMLDNSILNVALPTIGRQLGASATALQWVTGVYAVVFGGLMLAVSALADRIGRRTVMLVGLAVLALASLATVFVRSPEQLVLVRATMGVAAAMTTPGSLSLAFRLFESNDLRIRATTVISTVGLVGLAVGPIAGGFALSFAPWQSLLLVNVPVAVLAFVAIRIGIPADQPSELHRDPVDGWGALLGTATIVAALVLPTLFVEEGFGSWSPWAYTAAGIALGAGFVLRERKCQHPLLDVKLMANSLVSSGLAFKAAASLAVAGMGYLVTLQLQLDWGWTPAQAALGMLPQVVVLIAGGWLIGPLVTRLGLNRAATLSAGAVVLGLGVYAFLGNFGYGWIALSLAFVAAGMRVVGVVAGNNVMRGVPSSRTTLGAALVDTSGEIATGAGIAISGTVVAAVFTGHLTITPWTAEQTTQFRIAVMWAGMSLTALAAGLVTWGIVRSRPADSDPEPS